MAKYSLIVRDKTYMALLQYGAMQNPPRTFGKLVNEILDGFIEAQLSSGQRESQAVCFVCGKKASIVSFGKGRQKFFVCDAHKSLARKTGSFREIKK